MSAPREAWSGGSGSVQCEAFAPKVRNTMGKLRFVTAGESHGAGILAWISGLPAGLRVDLERVNVELRRRQLGYGRGGRQKIETDAAQFLAGLRGGVTTGAPIAFVIWNKDHESWKDLVSPYARGGPKLTQVRPGHADLAGALKYGLDDARDVLMSGWIHGEDRLVKRAAAVALTFGKGRLVLLGFFTWEGGFIGIQTPNAQFRRFAGALAGVR